jgi:hypothetical protein
VDCCWRNLKKRLVERYEFRWEDVIKTVVEEIRWYVADWTGNSFVLL